MLRTTSSLKIPTFTEKSIIEQPTVTTEEITNLRRTFLLYAKLPKEYLPEVKKCENKYEENKDLFKKLVALKWELQGKNTSAESLEVLKQQHVPS